MTTIQKIQETQKPKTYDYRFLQVLLEIYKTTQRAIFVRKKVKKQNNLNLNFIILSFVMISNNNNDDDN